MVQLALHWTDLRGVWHFRIFLKSVEKIQLSSKPDKNMWWCIWLQHCATSRVPFPIGPLGFFYWFKPSGRTVALESTQSVTEMRTRDIFLRVKAAGAWDWQNCRLHVRKVHKFWEPVAPGALRICPGLWPQGFLKVKGYTGLRQQ